MRHPSLKHHPSPLRHGWELMDGHCRPVRHTRPAFPAHLPTPEPGEDGEDDDESDEEVDDDDDDDDVQRWREYSSESESSEAETSDSD